MPYVKHVLSSKQFKYVNKSSLIIFKFGPNPNLKIPLKQRLPQKRKWQVGGSAAQFSPAVHLN